jgi:hypothetical protein
VESQLDKAERGVPQLKSNGLNANLNFSREDNMPQSQPPRQQSSGRMPQGQSLEGDATTIKTVKNEKPKIGRNDIVKVKYPDGKIKEVKFKKVESEVNEGMLEIVE